MMRRRRAVILSVLIGLMIVLALVLSSGIDTLDLGAGRLVETGTTSGEASARGVRGANQDVTLPSDRLFTILVLTFLAAVLVSTILMVVDRKTRPRLLFGLFTLAALVLLGLFFPRGIDTEREELLAEEEESEAFVPIDSSNPDSRLTVALPEEFEGSRWPMIVTAVLATMLALLTLAPLGIFLLRRARRRRIVDSAEEVLSIAEDAAREIESGADPIGVVQRCYARMLRALSQESGVNPLYRTPREFAAAMRDEGLHSDGVSALTEMFELVRYGGREDGLFAQRAHACLSALRLSHESA